MVVHTLIRNQLTNDLNKLSYNIWAISTTYNQGPHNVMLSLPTKYLVTQAMTMV